MRPGNQRLAVKAVVIFGIAALVVVFAALAPPLPQDAAYHQFADQRRIWSIPNFWNVVSNLPFLVLGVLGSLLVLRRKTPGGLPQLRAAYLIFFLGVTLVAAGSGYYHLSPSNHSLVWDRLPITLAFMAFFAALVGESISVRTGVRLLWPLIAAGVLSVAYWHFSELQGRGDLRPYILVQFLPLLLTPFILWLFRSPWSSNGWIWAVLGAYLLSKAAEVADEALFQALGLVSGHTIKHLVAALAATVFLAALRFRTPAETET